MFIIEGSDHLGKTTASNVLVAQAVKHAEHFKDTEGYITRPVRYVHMTRPNIAFDFFEDYQDIISLHAIQDRFHLGALVWHDGVMDQHKLRIIEGWLASLGSYIVIFFAEDDEFYKQLLLQSSRVEMFDIDKIVHANRLFRDMVYGSHPFTPHFDAFWTMTETTMWPDHSTIQQWLEAWFQRLQHIGRR